jgi:hypothetical protein
MLLAARRVQRERGVRGIADVHRYGVAVHNPELPHGRHHSGANALQRALDLCDHELHFLGLSQHQHLAPIRQLRTVDGWLSGISYRGTL